MLISRELLGHDLNIKKKRQLKNNYDLNYVFRSQ